MRWFVISILAAAYHRSRSLVRLQDTIAAMEERGTVWDTVERQVDVDQVNGILFSISRHIEQVLVSKSCPLKLYELSTPVTVRECGPSLDQCKLVGHV